jgi:sulfite reductase alpha subunit-like flavoprotein
MKDPRKKIWILFASQTGNSEQAARSIAELLPEFVASGKNDNNNDEDNHGWYGQVMQLDDFLELEHAPWTPIVILCLSSYGAGQAPMGGHRFREFCDYIVENHDNSNAHDSHKPQTRLLEGIKFALLGLGDSKYTTFFDNPKQTLRALDLAGATIIGSVGKADASNQQLEAIETWISNLWKPLKEALQAVDESNNKNNNNEITEERILEWQTGTCQICAKINPDFKLPSSSSSAYVNRLMMFLTVGLPLIIAVLAALISYALMRSSEHIPSSL